MRTRWNVCWTVAAIVALGLWAPLRAQNQESLDHFPQWTGIVTTSTGKEKFTIWVADTPARSEQGLMYVHSIDHDRGMLFPRNNVGRMTMWMKNTLIPLDMLFVDEQGVIIYIRHNATPESETTISVPFPIVTPAAAVLELAGGECDRRHISQGDRLTISRDP